MCELFGMSCNSPDTAIFSLKKFAELSPKNPDGWGVAYYENGKAHIDKQTEMGNDYLNIIKKAKSNIIIAHLRCKTRGKVCQKNCHPFKREFIDPDFNRDWVFAHNGDIKNIVRHKRAVGDTDSESAFLNIIDKIDEYTSSGDFKGIYPGIKKGIRYIFAKSSRSKLNFLMSDGTLLYAFNHSKSKPMYFLKRETKPYGNAFLVSTTDDIIKSQGEVWKEMPLDKLLVICNGEVLIQSSRIT